MIAKLLRGLLFPTVFGGSLAAFHFLQAVGAEPGAALFVMTIGNLVVVAALETASRSVEPASIESIGAGDQR